MSVKSELEMEFNRQMIDAGLRGFERQFKFHPSRRWKFDFAFPRLKIAIEIDGGVWSSGAHTRGTGYNNDREKDAEAMILGWSVLRMTDKHIKNGKGIEWLIDLIEKCD